MNAGRGCPTVPGSCRRSRGSGQGSTNRPIFAMTSRSQHTFQATMSEAEIRSFFDRYTAAFSALDVGGILGHFAFPCQIATETAGWAFADRASIEADMS